MGTKIGIWTVGVIQALICLCLSLPILSFGFYWIVLDIIGIITGHTGNLTGIGFVIGLPAVGIGSIFSFAFISAILLLKLNPKGRKFTVVFMSSIVFSLFLLARTILFYPWRLALFGWKIPSWLFLFIGVFYVISIVFLLNPQTKKEFVSK